MAALAKSKTQGKPKSILDQFKGAKPKSGLPLLKFTEPGRAIAAEFIARRPVKNQMGEGRAVDVLVLEDSDGADLGERSFFESGDITQHLDAADLKRGDIFYLRFNSVNPKTGWKTFVFEIASRANGQQPPADDNIPF